MEATSSSKRAFVAKQLFPDIADDHNLSRIADLASLIHWWDIEPAQQAHVAEHAIDLRRKGESIRNIAATLRISEGKVRAATSDFSKGR